MFDVVIFPARHVILTIGLMAIFMTNASGAANSVNRSRREADAHCP
jgi:hypothetical protein